MRQLVKGNEAVIHAAIAAGCRAYFGYPITPASEIAESASVWLPRSGGVFVQAESEIGAIQMVYGASSAGVRCMTAGATSSAGDGRASSVLKFKICVRASPHHRGSTKAVRTPS